MTWIKICGITNLEDAQTAVEAGADAVGFVLWPKSSRYVTAEVVRGITTKLPDHVEKVGVFVHEDGLSEAVARLIDEAGLTAMQLQSRGADVAGYCKVVPDTVKIFLGMPPDAIPLYSEWIAAAETMLRDSPGSAVLLDSGTSQRPGGTGKNFDWRGNRLSVGAIAARVPVIVAGGLGPANVKDAIAILRPWGVDVCSGVEAKPGKKDPEKIRAFVAAVREAEGPR